jgi:hypothetical protein
MESKFKTTTGKVALFAVMTAVTVVLNLIMVPMPQPLAEYDASPVLIYGLGVLMDPILAFLTIAVAMGIGVGYKVVTFGFPPVFILGAMFVRGVEAALISGLVRWRKGAPSRISIWETVSMGIGCVWETFGFFGLDALLFGIAYATIDVFTIIDLIFIPLAVGVVVAIRSRLGIKRLT